MNIKVGDLLEIPTVAGYSYVLVVFFYDRSPRYGFLIKAFNKKFIKRPSEEELKTLVAGKEDFYTFSGFNRRNTKELGITRVGNLGDQGFNYENLPKMWTFRPAIKSIKNKIKLVLLNVNIPSRKHVAVKIWGNGKKEKNYYKLNNSLKGISSVSCMNVIALKEQLEKNYDPWEELKLRWEKN